MSARVGTALGTEIKVECIDGELHVTVINSRGGKPIKAVLRAIRLSRRLWGIYSITGANALPQAAVEQLKAHDRIEIQG